MNAEQRITSMAALRVVSDEQRHRILVELIREESGASALAKRLRLTRTQVYYHLKLLEQHGFIRVAATRAKGRVAERLYRATARHFTVDTKLIGSPRALQKARVELLEGALDDLRASRGEALVTREIVRLRPTQLLALRGRIAHLVQQLDNTQQEGEPYELALALFRAP